MKTKNFICGILLGTFALFVSIVSFPVSSFSEEAVCIKGTYKLISRTLPNGKVLKEPDIIGFTTYTKDKRDVFFAVKGDNGQYGGLIIKSNYTINEKYYTEKNIAFLKNFGAKTIVAALKEGKEKVKIGDGRIEFALPTSDPALPVVIEGDLMTIGAKGRDPVDVYQRINK